MSSEKGAVSSLLPSVFSVPTVYSGVCSHLMAETVDWSSRWKLAAAAAADPWWKKPESWGLAWGELVAWWKSGNCLLLGH